MVFRQKQEEEEAAWVEPETSQAQRQQRRDTDNQTAAASGGEEHLEGWLMLGKGRREHQLPAVGTMQLDQLRRTERCNVCPWLSGTGGFHAQFGSQAHFS